MDFTFGRDKKEDEHAVQPGAANAAPDSGGVASATSAAAREEATKAATLSPRKRGRPRADSSVGAGDNSNVQAVINGELARQLDALHEPETWGALLAMPADAAKVWTGHERWTLAERERKTLGLTGSAFARTLMITNPRALALLMLTSALFSTYVPRSIAQLKEMKAEADKKAKEKGSNVPAAT